MLDAPDKWFADGSTLSLWMPDSLAPSQTIYGTRLPIAVDLRNASDVQIDGLAIRRVDQGIVLTGSHDIGVYNSSVVDTADEGLVVLQPPQGTWMPSSGVHISANVFARTGGDAINLGYGYGGVSVVTNNNIADSGVLVDATGQIISLPRFSDAAIYVDGGSTVTGNTIRDTGKIGIFTGSRAASAPSGSMVSGNVVSGWAKVLDDIGAIYTSHAPNDAVITGNVVQWQSPSQPQAQVPRPAMIGKPPGAVSQAQGIYVDEGGDDVQIDHDVIVGADNGLHIHISTNNKIASNWIYDSGDAAMLFDDDTAPKTQGNTIDGNLMASTVAGALAFDMTAGSQGGDPAGFATFPSGAGIAPNRYHDRTQDVVASTSWSGHAGFASPKLWTLANWQDVGGWGAARQHNTAYSIASASLLPASGALPTSQAGFVAPQNVPNCTSAQGCFTSTAAGGKLVTSAMTTKANQLYRVSFDLYESGSTTSPPTPIAVALYSGPFDMQSSTPALQPLPPTFQGDGTWRRHHFYFRTTAAVRSPNASSLFFMHVDQGATIGVANVAMVEATTGYADTDIIVNPGASPEPVSCSSFKWGASVCGGDGASPIVHFFDTDLPMGPGGYTIPPYSAVIVYLRDDTAGADSDGDGIADSQDSCAGTALYAEVNATGCSLTSP